MKRKESHPITRHSINLYAGDFVRLQQIHTTRLGAGKTIRDLVRAHIRSIEETAAQRLPPEAAKQLDFELEETDV
jgi:hypothetical protein